MIRIRNLLFLSTLLLAIGIYGCDQGTTALTDSGIEYEKKLFVWSGLNTWYFWQDRVPDLADERLEDMQSLNAYFNRFKDERDLFENLRYHEDRFSWFIDDYEVHEAARLGSSKSFGFRFGLLGLENSDEVFGYVQYVIRDSHADDAGLKRGEIFNRINGQRLSRSNYPEVLAADHYRMGFAELTTNQHNLTRLTDKDKVIEITAKNIRENPIHFARTYLAGGSTIGYIVYNAFRFNYHRELNNRFGSFKEDGVNELILDLRYNSGGALITSALLATLVSGIGSESDFAKLVYNDKRSNQNSTYSFMDNLIIYDEDGALLEENAVLNSLNLNRVYVLTSPRTASASEVVINGLRAHGVEVVIIGEKTAGKDEGSITLYDAPPSFTLQSRENLNPNHKRAIQPIIFKIFNASGDNYPNGFIPDVIVSETSYLTRLPPLGHQQEPLFKAAISHITGSFLALRTEDHLRISDRITDSRELMDPFHDEFYLIPSDLEHLNQKNER